jgi:hypothetical protein
MDRAIRAGIASLAVGSLIALGILEIERAYGHDNGQYSQVDPKVKDWVTGLKNNDGVGCCATADGFPTEVEWDTKQSKYRVLVDGHWYEVPDEAVIHEPNRLGYPVVWYYWMNNIMDGSRRLMIRCFLPGTEG